MTEQDQIKELASLDGWTWGEGRMNYDGASFPYTCFTPPIGSGDGTAKPYLTSYDAIIPLVQKQDRSARLRLYLSLACGKELIELTPAQLCEALLRATGKWKE